MERFLSFFRRKTKQPERGNVTDGATVKDIGSINKAPDKIGSQQVRTALSQALKAGDSATKLDLGQDYILYAALDFGTTFSGYAFAFKSDPDKVHMNKNWGASVGNQSYKTPTSVLTGPGRKYEAFGYEAEDMYSKLTEDEKPKYELYRHFKMLLHREPHLSLTRTTVTSESGHERPAIDIFAMAMKYLKDHLIESVTKQVENEPDPAMIKWIVTVPAIWTDSAKHFMREAAYKAGFMQSKFSPQLTFALEPEAAALFCNKDSNIVSPNPGTKYIVIDAGGGTVDITAHEVLEDDCVQELTIPGGGPSGGLQVNKEFIKLLENIFAKEFLDNFRNEHSAAFLPMIQTFENVKKKVKIGENTTMKINMPYQFGKAVENHYEKDLSKVFKDSQVSGVSFANGIIVLDNETSLSLFTDVVKAITDHVSQVLKHPNLQDLQHVLLVGGFGESNVLQQSLKDIMPPDVTMTIPDEAQLAVIKGALVFAFHSRRVVSRIAKKTYGTDIMRRFDPSIHDRKRKRVDKKGQAWCDDVFLKFITKGQSVSNGMKFQQRYTPTTDRQEYMTIDVFCTDEEDLKEVEYVDQPYMERLGGIIVEMPDTSENFDRSVNVEFVFGGTEIQLRATDKASGKVAEKTIDFMMD